jgi:TadE-like protein
MILKTIMHRRAATKDKPKAQGLVEFALILPILLLVLFGIIDFGWMVFNFSQIYNGVREGARFGSVPGFDPSPQYVNCFAIADRIRAQAGFAGLRTLSSGDIKIYYDDGRPAGSGVDPAIPASWTDQVVGVCNPSTGLFVYNTIYAPQDGGPARTPDQLTGQYVRNGDRIVIVVNRAVPFLTPFIKALATSGVTFSFTTARSIFPGGLPA